MFRIISSNINKWSQTFLDEVKDSDYWDQKGVTVPGFVTDENLQDYLEDDIEEEPEPEQKEPVPGDVPDLGESFLDEVPTGRSEYGIPDETIEISEDNAENLIYTAIDNGEMIGFDYITRNGRYAGFRIVEPHYTYMSDTTGNEVLVSFDKTRNDIRAFIVAGDHIMKGVRYKNVQFTPRDAIMRGVL